MLVLSRSTDERLLIGPEIVITILRIGPTSVRIGIDAPKELNIVREELKVARPHKKVARSGDASK